MAKDPQRQRLTSVLGLWAVLTRAVLSDEAKTGWGVSLALLCALFFFFVGRSQRRWLGQPRKSWWTVACRADVAAFAAMTAPASWLLPLVVFLGVFKATANREDLVSGGALWKGAPLLLLLHPRRWYAVDVAGVAALVAARHREPGDMHTITDYHAEHERFVLVDSLSCLVLSSAGAPVWTRLALLAGTLLLGSALHLKYPRQKKIGYWDLANAEQRGAHAPVLFRGVNIDK
jgi:hypothetical protein